MLRLTIVLKGLLLMSAPLIAQGTQAAVPPSRNDTTVQGAPAPAPAGAATGDTLRIETFVRYADGRAAEFARIVVSDTGSRAGQRSRYARTDSVGHFAIDSVKAGTYELHVFSGGSTAPHVQRFTVNGSPIPDFLVPLPRGFWRSFVGSSGFVTFVVLALFLITVYATRWHHIARSLTAILESEFRGLAMRLQTEVNAQSPEVKALRASLDEQWERVRTRQEEPWYSSFYKGKKNEKGVRPWGGFGMGDFLWWSRGVENAAWATIHETERQLVAYLAPAERVRVHLLEVQALLREVKSPPAIAIADGIRDSLGPTKAGDANREQEQRALLARSLQFLNTDRDKTFAALMEWQNKASWLMLTAAIIILFLTVTVGNAELFLAGAAGGFLSRLARALKNDEFRMFFVY
jgi:hypothetical protein